MNFNKIFVFFILAFSMTLAQYPRIVLMEEATNASCPDCAVYSPQIQDFAARHFGTTVMVQYHAWWPGTDPMYSANVAENNARINYYQYYFVPIYGLDGVTYGEPNNMDDILFKLNKHASQSSPVWIDVKHSIEDTNFVVNVSVTNAENISGDSLKLRVAVIEREINFASSPGSNGETYYTNVFRKFLPDAAGTDIAFSGQGTQTFSFSIKIDGEWNAKELAAVAWIQNDANKKVLQSNISVPTFRINSSESSADLLKPNSEVVKHYAIFNSTEDTLKLAIKTDVKENTADWDYSVIYQGAEYDSFKVSLPAGDTLKYGLKIKVNNSEGSIKIGIVAINENDPHKWGNSSDYYGLAVERKILFVDADGGGLYETYWDNVLKQFSDFGVKYFRLEHKYIAPMMAGKTHFDFPVVLWNASNASPAFDSADVKFLENYLDDGGQLLLCGQNIGRDIFESNGGSNFQLAKDFYNNYLDAEYLNDNLGYYLIGGVPETIFDNLNFAMNTIYEHSVDVIKSYTDSHDEIFLFREDSTKFAGIYHKTNKYKAIYLAFSLEQLIPRSKQKELLGAVLTQFGYIIEDVKDKNDKPLTFDLLQNYPNPFSAGSSDPVTTIKYSLPDVGTTHELSLQLTVYDVLGRKVATLVNKPQSAGTYSVKFNAENLPSGVYFYTLRYGNKFKTRKMILLK